MKRAFLAILIPLSILPFEVDAAQCFADDYTVVYINGIFTDTKDKADSDRKNLSQQFGKFTGRSDVSFITGYNPSHLGGAGDLIEAATQKINAPISDFDLVTILTQIHADVHTRKILLVGHSQGTFYTNEIYDYLLSHGVSKQSLAVYNIATPASFVAGGGAYLTSSNDKVIQEVRSTAARFGVAPPLPANITIPQSADDITDEYGGHYLTTVYLRGAPGRIVDDISTALRSLQAGQGESEDCFIPPEQSLAHSLEGAAFAVADPIATGAHSGAVAVAGGVMFAGDFAIAFVGNAIAEAKSIAGFVTNPTSVLPPANMDTALHGLNVVKVLYGSSVTGADVQDLLLDSPQTTPPPVQTQQQLPPSVQKPVVAVVKKETPPKTQGTVLGAITEASPYVPFYFPQFPPVMIGAGGGAGGSAAAAVITSFVPAPPTPSGPTIPAVATTTPLTAPVFSVDECAHSLSAGFCLIPKSSASLSWSDSGGSVYEVFVNGALAASTANTSVTIPLAANATSTLEVVAVDSLGTAATSTAVDVAAYPEPVRINEVGWGGTDASPSDQWIELKNMTPYTLDLSALTLFAQNGSFSIPLSGTIPATDSSLPYEGFLTVAKNSSMLLANSPAHLFSAPALSMSTSGEELHLTYSDAAGTVVDATPAVSLCGGWCAGSAAQATRFYSGAPSVIEPVSMERLGADGSLAASWESNDTYSSGSLTIQDSAGNIIRGTPGFANSSHYPSYGWFCAPDTFPITDGQTYHPQRSPCHYLSGFVDDATARVGELFKGDPGNATALDWHLIQSGGISNGPYGDTTEAVLFDPSIVLTAGDHMFTAIFARHVVQDTAGFQSFFESGSTTGALPPNKDYRIVQWVYGN